MKQIKITVLENTFNKELAEMYASPGLTSCKMNQKRSGILFQWLAKT